MEFRSSSDNRDKLLSILNSFQIVYTIDQPTRVTSESESCIDNILVSKSLTQYSAKVIHAGLSDHSGQTIKIVNNSSTKFVKLKKVKVLKRKITATGIYNMQVNLSTYDWSDFYNVLPDVEKGAKYISETIHELIRQNCVLRSSEIKKNPISWFTPDLKQLRKK